MFLQFHWLYCIKWQDDCDDALDKTQKQAAAASFVKALCQHSLGRTQDTHE
jgi:hypothetical protein